MSSPVPRFLTVDPRTLYMPTHRLAGADPYKLQVQIARYGSSAVGMPPLWVEEDPDGRLRILHGATRAVRIAKLSPGTLVRVEVTTTLKRPLNTRVTVADMLP